MGEAGDAGNGRERRLPVGGFCEFSLDADIDEKEHLFHLRVRCAADISSHLEGFLNKGLP